MGHAGGPQKTYLGIPMTVAALLEGVLVYRIQESFRIGETPSIGVLVLGSIEYRSPLEQRGPLEVRPWAS